MPRIKLETEKGRLTALKRMLLVREFENRVADVFADDEMPGFVHLSQGQEATAVGSNFGLENGDYVTGTHRAHGHSIAMGLDPDRLMAELYGKETGYCFGRGGSMHVADPQGGMLGAQPIVGASVPLGTGAAITSQVKNENFVAMAVTGDGATAAGQVHEAINLAATWQLPVVFLVENNLYSEGMTLDEQHNIEDLSDMSASYGLPGESINGQNVRTVYETVREARERAAKGGGPTLIEAKTYRFRGHYEGDPEPYRTDEEKREWQENHDPIANYRKHLVERNEINEETFEEMCEKARQTIDEAVQFARQSEEPNPEAAYDEVFAEPVPEVEMFRTKLKADGDRPEGEQ